MKRSISLILVLTILLSAFSTMVVSAYSWNDLGVMTVDEALEIYETDNYENVETHRYYFLMPNGHNGEISDDKKSDFYGKYAPSWYTKLDDGTPATSTAGIYWWNTGVADPEAWFGYLPSGVDETDPDVYYANVPKDVTEIVWNNAVDGGGDTSDPIYYCSALSDNITCEYYDIGESPNYPDGVDSFDNMIYVIDPDLVSISDLSLKQICGGEWYYYYGNGCYGFTQGGDEANCLRDDHFDANGNHIFMQEFPSDNPTDKPTQGQTQKPSVAPEIIPTRAESDKPTIDSDYVISGPGETDPSKINGKVYGVMGDADYDSEISVMDATEIQLQIAQLIIMNEVCELLSDADGDGAVSVMDATEIQLYVAKYPVSGVIGRILYSPYIEPTEPPTEPPTQPTEPPTQPTEPPTEPTEPPTQPTEPPTQPTEPPTQPTEPPTQPTEPPTQPPTEPTEPAKTTFDEIAEYVQENGTRVRTNYVVETYEELGEDWKKYRLCYNPYNEKIIIS